MAFIDIDSMTLDEIELVENLAGASIDTIMDAGKPRGRAFKAFIFVFKKRTDPNFTIEQAGKISMGEAAGLFGGDEEDPKE